MPVLSKMRKRVLVVPWSMEPMNHCLSFSSSCAGTSGSLLSLELCSGRGESVGEPMVRHEKVLKFTNSHTEEGKWE